MSGFIKNGTPAIDLEARGITDLIDITQQVDLDVVESDTNTNNAKVGVTTETDDQTGAEIKAAYEAEANTNALTDALKSSIEGIVPPDGVTVKSVSSSANPAALGLTTTQHSATFGDSVFDVTSITGSYADDAVGSIMNAEIFIGSDKAVLLEYTGGAIAEQTIYFSSDSPDLVPQPSYLQFTVGSANFVYVGSITTGVGTEYVYSLTIPSGKTIQATNSLNVLDATDVTGDFYLRAWDGDPTVAGNVLEAQYENPFTTAEKSKLASIDAAHYGAPLQTQVQLTAITEAAATDKERRYVEDDLSDYFYDEQAASGDLAPDDQTGGTGWWKQVAVGGETPTSIKSKYESNADTNVFTDAEKTAVATNSAKVGITPTQASNITTNNAKVGITPTQASNITTNNAKATNVSTNLDHTKTTTTVTITSSDGNDTILPSAIAGGNAGILTGSDKTKIDNTVESVAGTPSGGDKVTNIISLTQAEYDAASKNATTFYIIVG